MRGELFVYGAPREGGVNGLVAMRCGEWRKGMVVHVAGLTDGLLSCPWVEGLAEAVGEVGWGFVQPVMRSSYVGYGQTTLDDDVEDLERLVEVMEGEGVERVVVVGHSTGCQDAVWLLKKSTGKKICGAVLVGPVSDREYAQTLPNYDALLSTAQSRLGTDEFMPRSTDPSAAITPERFLSLSRRGGDDDMFSTDFTDSELSANLSHVPCPTLVVMSTQDEYVPQQGAISNHAQRICTALRAPHPPLLLDDNHTIVSPSNHKALCDAVVGFLGGL